MLIDDFIVHSKDIIYGCVFKSFNFSFHNFKKLTIFLGLSTKIIDIKKKNSGIFTFTLGLFCLKQISGVVHYEHVLLHEDQLEPNLNEN